jgi:TatD DNase family protein
MRLVDVHCHLESDLFSSCLDQIIADAEKAGIVKLITSSITPDEWELSRSIAQRYDSVDFALGVHPWYGMPDDIKKLDGLYRAGELGAVAIGEIGLDSKVDRPIEFQKKLFESQLKIAKEIELPIIVHCRGAFNELIESIRAIGLPERGGIIHSFSGSVELAREFIKYGLSFSFGGVLTYRDSKKRTEVLRSIYPDNFLLETDSPDIPPIEARGGPNVPTNILYNLSAAAEILGLDRDLIAETTTDNAVRIFDLDI